MNKLFENLQSKWNVLAMVLVAMMSLSFASCGGDDDDDVGGDALSDYYFQFEVVDRGTLSDAMASQLMGQLNAEAGSLTAYKKSEAIYVFDNMVESLRVDFAGVNEFELSFRAKLMTGKSTVKSKVIHIKTIGCTVD